MRSAELLCGQLTGTAGPTALEAIGFVVSCVWAELPSRSGTNA